eukprot:GFKZ01011126.1.p1 GENE.GFKZ01011126.1~~GFKZ01011126.1.p1  ORF type:complete len:905 (-),score=114.20 GFKZ01011126.1:866-3361(-)
MDGSSFQLHRKPHCKPIAAFQALPSRSIPRPTNVLAIPHTYSCPRSLERGTAHYPTLRNRTRIAHRPHYHVHAPPVAVATSIPSLEQGVLLQFQTSSGLRRLALAVKPDGKRNWIVRDLNGISHSVSQKQITFILGPSTEILDVDSPSGLESLEWKCRDRAIENEELLQLVWDAVNSDGGIDGTRFTDVPSVADVIFGDDTPISLYTTHLLLSNDQVYFKERNIKGRLMYEARPEAHVQEARALQKAEAARKEKIKARQGLFVKAFEQKSFDPLEGYMSVEEQELLIESLKLMVAELCEKFEFREGLGNVYRGLNKPSKALVREAFEALGMKIGVEGAMEILVAFGVYDRHENLVLINSGIPHLADFDAECLECVEKLLSQETEDIDQGIRRDLSHLTSYAIDSADTSEVDDAISWDPESQCIYVHVADPTRYFPEGPSNPLLQVAFRRVATLYLPGTKLTMFPSEVATKLFSLDAKEHSKSHALSFGFRITEDGTVDEGSVTIEPSLISPPIRFTYDEAEAMLEGKVENEHCSNVQKLYRRAEMRREWRELEGGAIIVRSLFAEVNIKKDGSGEQEISLSAVDADTKSWRLVSELMITACSVAAEFAKNTSIKVPFRGQQPFDYPEDDVLESVRDGPARAALAFRNATPSILGTQPMEHASLGLDSYMQVTSPIRRSIDLIAHFQLKAQLRGAQGPFSEEEVQAEIGRTNDMSRTLRNLESRAKRYWQLEYLRRRGEGQRYRVQYVRPLKEGEKGRGLVQFEDFGFQLASMVPTDVKPGAMLTARVAEVNPRLGTSRLEAMHERPGGEPDKYLGILDDSLSSVSYESDPT